MSGYARTERQALADTLTRVGPDGPTLCTGWRTADLAAHLVTRERRPIASAGIVIKPLSRVTDRVRTASRDRHPYEVLVDRVRTGPPAWSPTRVPTIDAAANTIEFFVHHEDVRRAGHHWEPRELDPDFEDELWARLRRSARMMFRAAPVGVTLVRDTRQDRPRQTMVAKPSTAQMVTVCGSAGELVLFAFGRTGAARVEPSGDPSAIDRLLAAKLGI
jgi:uncharacterized protein (TIGR03085 family)